MENALLKKNSNFVPLKKTYLFLTKESKKKIEGIANGNPVFIARTPV